MDNIYLKNSLIVSKIYNGLILTLCVGLFAFFIAKIENRITTEDNIRVIISPTELKNQYAEKHIHKIINNALLYYKNEYSKSYNIKNLLLALSFVKDVLSYRTYSGILNIDIILRKPIAVIRISKQHAFCMDNKGFLFSTTCLTNSKFIEVSIDNNNFDKFNLQNICDLQIGRDILTLITEIITDDFFSAIIKKIEIDKIEKVKLFATIPRLSIEIGDFSDIKAKLNRLLIFYREIIPFKGWCKYKRVNVEFNNQIVCE